MIRTVEFEKYAGTTSSIISIMSGCGFSTIKICKEIIALAMSSVNVATFTIYTGFSISQNLAIHNNCRWSWVRLLTGSSISFGKFKTACHMWKRCSTVDKLLSAVLFTFRNVLKFLVFFLVLAQRMCQYIPKLTWSTLHKLADFLVQCPYYVEETMRKLWRHRSYWEIYYQQIEWFLSLAVVW